MCVPTTFSLCTGRTCRRRAARRLRAWPRRSRAPGTPRSRRATRAASEMFASRKVRCHSTASTCPLVQGIGKHTSNMGRLALVPCCGREWYLSTVISFLRYAIRPAPTDAELAKFGAGLRSASAVPPREDPVRKSVSPWRGDVRALLVRTSTVDGVDRPSASTVPASRRSRDAVASMASRGHDTVARSPRNDTGSMSAQVKVKKERLTGKAAAAGSIAATAGMGKGTQLALRAKGYAELARRRKGWNFFAKTGVNWAELKKRLTEKGMTSDDESTGLLKDLRAVYDRRRLPKNMTYGGSQKHRFPRPGEPVLQARFCAKSSQDLVEWYRETPRMLPQARRRRVVSDDDPPALGARRLGLFLSRPQSEL